VAVRATGMEEGLGNQGDELFPGERMMAIIARGTSPPIKMVKNQLVGQTRHKRT
jgi:hypothetical protein